MNYIEELIQNRAKEVHYDDFLMHYGLKGQKWGIRRWQNEDGTFNEAGKERYFGKSSGREYRSYKEVPASLKKQVHTFITKINQVDPTKKFFEKIDDMDDPRYYMDEEQRVSLFDEDTRKKYEDAVKERSKNQEEYMKARDDVINSGIIKLIATNPAIKSAMVSYKMFPNMFDTILKSAISEELEIPMKDVRHLYTPHIIGMIESTYDSYRDIKE